MQEPHEHMDELIAKYLAGEALPEEAMELEDWKSSSTSNMAYVIAAEKAYLLAHHREAAKPVDAARLFERVLGQIEIPAKKEAKVFRITDYFTPWRAVAAMLVLGLGVLFSIYLNKNTNELTAYEAGNAAVTHKLADGTQVQMQPHSKLEVMADNGKERRLRLTGEASFTVMHNAAKPLVIDVSGISIKDIGTVFRVKAQAGSDSVWVHVAEGIVEMLTETDSLVLHEEEEGIYIRSQHQLIAVSTKIVSKESIRVFHFSETSLKEVVKKLNETYPEKIKLGNKELEHCIITVDFENQPADVVVSIIAETLGLTLEKTNSGYLLSGTACTQ